MTPAHSWSKKLDKTPEHYLQNQYYKYLDNFSYSTGATFLYLSSHCSGQVLKHTAKTSQYGPDLFFCGNEW